LRVGILGGGQLGRMLALAGYPLGLRFRVLDPASDAPAADVAERVVGRYEDPAALDRFADGLDLATYEFENVPVATVRALAGRLPVHPAADALETAQDRLAEKRLFETLGIPTPPFAPVDSRADLEPALARIGPPAVLKSRRGGYDGKRQHVIRAPGEADAAWAAVGASASILEGLVPFARELSVLAVRDRGGEVRVWPLVENHHRGGILRLSLAPAPGAAALEREAERHATAILERFGYVGVLAVEFFEHGGRLVANEMAPRVHNSGHWTIEGAETSQFENHVRALCGLPLGATGASGHAGMLNLIGGCPEAAAVLAVPGARLHLYGKAARPGRKLGHVTVVAPDPAARDAAVAALRAIVEGAEA
jgi:5-(carboxyamino)imidazole ribonucleotide synthase